MYIPGANVERDLPTLHAFIDAHPLAILVTHAGDGLVATHVPVLLDRAAGPNGTLAFHLARANAHARSLIEAPMESLVIFSGPDAYISPEWYATKRETGRVVPTWNYVAVHAYGTPRTFQDAADLRAHLDALTARHEGPRPQPWQVGDAPADYIAQQMKAIVGVRFAIERLEGKWKMSQNRPAADIDGVIRGLGASPAPRDREVADIVRDRRPDTE